MMRERFLVKSTGANPDAVRLGFKKLLELLGGHSVAVVVVPTLGDLKHTILVDVLGPELSIKLIRDREISFPGGKQILLCGQATLKNFRRHDVYLDLWGSKFSVAELESLPCKAIVMVTWTPEDSVEWERSHDISVIFDESA